MDIHDIELLAARDLKEAAQKMSSDEARYLVDLYYQIQEFRKATGNQSRSLKEKQEPAALINGIFDVMETMENKIKRSLDYYSDTQHMGRWAREIVGIGPVISAGLLAHIKIERCQTVGAIWRFAGLDPTSIWEKGEKRPFNASLKRLCWIIGESFVKVSANAKDQYGKLYLERKAIEQRKNDAGEYADQAKAKLEKYKIKKTTDAYAYYSTGKLPPAHIHARAKRWAVKLFLSHYFEESYRKFHGKEPPVIYSIAMLNHIHKIEPEFHEPEEEQAK